MQVGVNLPLAEIGADLGAVRDYVHAAEALGYAHVRMRDHILGSDLRFHPEISIVHYSHETYVHEPFTLMAYLAAITKKLQLVTGILILPLRQTALVAKQAAEVDVLSGGRLRLGIGVGWNPVEFQALGQEFHNRGQRVEEQIAVLRALWTQEIVNFTGRWHQITYAGLNPLPVQRPIPIWMGAGVPVSPIPREAPLRRIARMADGWSPLFAPDIAGQEAIQRMRGYAREVGRDPASIGIDGRVKVAGSDPEEWITEVKTWEELGATHLTLATAPDDLKSADQHIDAIRRFKEQVGV